MTETYTDKYLYELIHSTMQAVEIDVELVQDNCGINMSYNFIRHHVGYDAKRLLEAVTELPTSISLEDYIKTITIHELGHALDRPALMESLDRTYEIFDIKNDHSNNELYNNIDLLSVIIEEHVMNITFEETAWNNAEMLNKQFHLVDAHVFETIRHSSLATYVELYKEDLAIYDQLVMEQSMQIA